MSRTNDSNPQIGDVLDNSSPEPPDGTPLLGPDSKVELYASAEIGGRWRQYAANLGPFVVAPDYDALVDGA
jgi:hypothetical protein